MLKKSQKNAQVLRNLIKKNVGVEITIAQSESILKNRKNPFLLKWHGALRYKELPKVNDFSEFYYGINNTRAALMGRVIAPQQNIVWGTGGHTATPVPVYSMGLKHWTSLLSGVLTHPKLGKNLQRVLGLD